MSKSYLDQEGLAHLIEKNDERYVKKEEGKVLSTNDFSDEYKQIVDDLNYTRIAFSSGSVTNSTNEIGATVTTAKATWKLNKTPKTLKIKFGSEAEEVLDVNATSKEYTGKNVTANTSIVITATDERDAATTKTLTIGFQPKVYWGIVDADAEIDSATALALEGSALASARQRTFSVNAAAGKKIAYIIPSSFGTPVFNVGGFDGGFVKAKTFEHTNASGYAQNYDVWLSVNAGLGQTSVTVK